MCEKLGASTLITELFRTATSGLEYRHFYNLYNFVDLSMKRQVLAYYKYPI